MNEMIKAAGDWMEKDVAENQTSDIYQINRKLNRFVMIELPLLYSGETMQAALQSLEAFGS
jgi:hypothetical protein